MVPSDNTMYIANICRPSIRRPSSVACGGAARPDAAFPREDRKKHSQARETELDEGFSRLSRARNGAGQEDESFGTWARGLGGRDAGSEKQETKSFIHV